VAARRGLLCVASDLPGSSFLEITAVGLACLTGYKSRLTALLQWSSTRRLHWSGNNELDTVLVSYFDKMYFEGLSSADGSKTLAAIKHFKPEVGRHGPLSLARSERCIKSWIRSAPRHQRVPLTFVVLAAILVYLVYHPGTCDLLRVAQLLPPAPEAGPQYAQWEFLLNPTELKVAGKTGLWDQAVVWDTDPWAADIFAALTKGRPGDEALWLPRPPRPSGRPAWPSDSRPSNRAAMVSDTAAPARTS
jgi:hypothetical protein